MSSATVARVCPDCGTEWAPGLTSCPTCHRLVHAEQLSTLAAEADRQATAGDLPAALQTWRTVLELLPPTSRQHEQVRARVDALSRQAEEKGAVAPPAERPSWARRAGPLGVLGFLAWKLKFALVFLLTKAKLLLLGLTKAGTLFSMLLSFGVYWTAWGWRFALGLVASMYVHEMGHVAALARLGIKATAPMFLPGFGALVRLKQYPASPREDARVGLAGPVWGLGAALCAYAAFVITSIPVLGAVAQWGARLNLFNLLPVGSLDGGRGFRALSRTQRFGIAAVAGGVAAFTAERWLWIFTVVAGLRLFGEPSIEGDATAFGEFLLLIGALGALTLLANPVMP